jgi:ribosomal protein S3
VRTFGARISSRDERYKRGFTALFGSSKSIFDSSSDASFHYGYFTVQIGCDK